jgi:hypothetical protein
MLIDTQSYAPKLMDAMVYSARAFDACGQQPKRPEVNPGVYRCQTRLLV